MRSMRFWMLLAVTLLPTPMVTGYVGVAFQDDFEDDPAVTEGLSGRLVGPFGPGDAVGEGFFPSNPAGTPGRWLPNKYPVDYLGGTPWFEPNDIDPDTNWQAYVAGGDFLSNATNKLWVQNNHQGDAAPAPGYTHYDNYSWDIFAQFTDPNGNPVAATSGQIVRGEFRWGQVSSSPVFVLTSDINAMQEDHMDTGPTAGHGAAGHCNGIGTGDAPGQTHPCVGVHGSPLHHPLSTWGGLAGSGTDNGVEGDELMYGIRRLEPKPYHASVIEAASGFSRNRGEGGIQTWVPDSTSTEGTAGEVEFASLVNASPYKAGKTIATAQTNAECSGFNNCIPGPFQLEFEFEVGADHYNYLRLTAEVLGQVTVELGDLVTVGAGGPIPMTHVVDRIEGINFSDTHDRQAQYWVDDIWIEILDGMMGPLMGDANGDGQITGADLISVQQNFGKTAIPGIPGDANFDGLVTGADLIAVQQNFGKVAGNAAVPEPATAAAIFVLAALISRRTKKTGIYHCPATPLRLPLNFS